MDIYVYSTDMTLLGVVDEINSLMWTRRYWRCGEFSLLAPLNNRNISLLRLGRLIMRKGDDEAGQIQYIRISKDNSGMDTIEVQGKFVTHWLGTRLILTSDTYSMATHTLLETLVSENMVSPDATARKIPSLAVRAGTVDDETLEYTTEIYSSLLDVCESRAQLAKIGFRIITDQDEGKHYFTTYKGLDRTSSQSTNPPAIFSPDFDNVLSQEMTSSRENLATDAYIEGQTNENAPRLIAEVSSGTYTGLERIECYYLASDIAQTVSNSDGTQKTIPDDKYIAMLAAKGASYLQSKIETNSFASTINPNALLKYKIDYDVGDRVTCINRQWGVTRDARITEATETWDSSGPGLSITFGESLPTLSETLKWR